MIWWFGMSFIAFAGHGYHDGNDLVVFYTLENVIHFFCYLNHAERLFAGRA